MSGWAAKQAKKAEWAEARKLDGLDATHKEVNDTRDAAMGKGEDQLFEKKLSKEEQKAEKERKKARRRVELKRGHDLRLIVEIPRRPRRRRNATRRRPRRESPFPRRSRRRTSLN